MSTLAGRHAPLSFFINASSGRTMRSRFRIFAYLLFGLLNSAYLYAAPVITPTAISASPASTPVGYAIVISISGINSGAATPADDLGASSTVTGTVTFTHQVTGSQFTTGSVAFTNNLVVAGFGGEGNFTRSFTIPMQTSQAGAYDAVVTLTAASSGTASGSFAAKSVLTVTGTPDLAVTGLTYPAGTAYRGGDVIPMTLSYTNRSLTSGQGNVPYVSTLNGDASFFQIEVVLSTNSTFGDADDFLLKFFQISATGGAPLNADDLSTTVAWNQVLPGNFSGSYYVLVKIDTLAGVNEAVEQDFSLNGNNIYFSPDYAAARISLVPTNFPTVLWASAGSTSLSDNPAISGDGRYTAFVSEATNLGAGDTNGVRDIFLYDRQNATTRRISLSQQGAQPNSASSNPAISANGTYVAFSSEATNLITDDFNAFSDVYVVNVLTGSIARVSVGTGGAQANGGSFKPAISASGRYVAFESTATNLIAAGTTEGVTHIYLRDRDVNNSGTFDTAGNVSTGLISKTTGGVAGNANSIQATVSGDGGYVAYASDASNLGGTVAAGIRNIYLRAVATNTTTLVTIDSAAGAANGSSRAPSINQNTGVSTGTFADGRYIAFGSEASDLVAGDTNGMSDIFVYDRVNATITRVSLSSGNVEATDTSSTALQLVGSINPSMSSTGRYVAFSSLAANLTAGDSGGEFSASDANSALDVFVRDRDASASGTFDTLGNVATTMVSVNRFGYQTQGLFGGSYTAASDVYPAISGDGRWVAFPSDAANTAGFAHGSTNRTSPDGNNFRDVFIYDRRINALPSVGTPPTVSISSPISGTAYDVNSTLTVVASAAASVGTVASVQFFVNGTSLSTDTTFPYNASWSPTAVGTFVLSALVTDSFGNQAVSNNVNITIAAVSPTAPVVAVISPVAGAAVFTSGATTVSANASDPDGTIASVQFYANGVLIGTDTTFPYSVAWVPVATGPYTLSAVATDNGGNRTTTTGVGTIAVTVTNLSAPTVSISAPLNAATVQVNATTSIIATTASAGSVASVQFLANGTVLGTASAAPFNFAWTPSVAGSYTLTAIATDNLGSQTTSAGVTVAVSAGTAPTVVINSPAAGTINVNVPQTIVATAVDLDGSISRVDFRANGLSIGSVSTFPYQFTWTPTNTGSYTLQAIATDNLGNQTTSTAVIMIVTSGTAPTVGITYPTSGVSLANGSTNTITAIATAISGTIASVQFFANGIALAAGGTISPYTATFSPVATGAYALTVIATDTLGNRTTSATVNVTVAANQAPTVSLSVASTAVFGTPTPISATATDIDGAISSVQFFANGVSLGTSASAPFSVSWTPIMMGSHAITAVATDNLGASTRSLTSVVTVLGGTLPNPPTVTLTAPGNATTIPINSTQSISATATAVAPFASIASVQFWVSDGARTSTAGETVRAFPYSINWGPLNAGGGLLGTYAAGTYTLYAIATDTAGNTATSSPVTITVAAAVPGTPTVSLVTPIDATTVTVNQPLYLSANATDPDGRVARVEFSANNIVVGSKTTFPYYYAWTPTAPGAYAITATVTDNDGNRTTSSAATITAAAATGSVEVVSLTFNNPARDASSVAANPLLAVDVSLGSKLIITATGVDAGGSIASVQFFANGTSLVTDASSPFYTTYTVSTLGSVVITALATDSSGNKIYSAPLFINSLASVDAQNGVVRLISPANGATYVSGQQIVFQATHNYGTDVSPKVDFYINGAQGTTLGEAPYQFIRYLTRAGTYDVQAVIRIGTETTYSSVANITVNSNTAPIVSISSPATGSVSGIGVPIAITATASDPDGTIAGVQFFANGVFISTDASFPYTATFNPAAVGVYVLTALATDSSGEMTMSSGVTVSVTSGTSPTVGVSAPAQLAAGSSGIVSATAAAGASGATIASVQFFANGLPIGTAGTFPYSSAFTPASTGTYVITAVATDTLGNVATSASTNVLVATNVAPTAVAISSASGSFALGVTATITANATDIDGSIASVQFLIDGVAIGTDTTSPYSIAWTPTTAGTYAQTVIATDNLGATTTSAAVNVTVTAGSSPAVNITSPVTGGFLSANGSVTITATATGATPALTIANVRFFANGVLLGTGSVFPYSATFLPTATGSYTLKAIATDSAGNQASHSVTVTVQANTAPTGVAIGSPSVGSTVGVGVATTITASATDADGTIASVQFFVNGASIGTRTAAPFTVSWTPTINGTYLLSVVAADNLGATTTSAVVSVTAGASNAPSGAITAPLAGTTIAVGSTMSVTAIASANASGATVGSVQFLDNGVSIGTDQAFPYAASWTPLSTGTHSLQILVTDTLGNQFVSAVVSVSVAANVAPSVSISAPAGGAVVGVGVATTVSASAADGDGSIASVQFFAGTTLIGTKTSAPYTISWTPISASGGAVALTAVATDNLGATTTSSAVAVTVSGGNAPTVAISGPATGSSVQINSSNTITATASAVTGTIASVQFLVNGISAEVDATFPYTAAWTPTTNGAYTIIAVAVDTAGNSTTSTAVVVTAITGVAPTVSIVNPNTGNAFVASREILFDAVASDPDGTIAKVEFIANGVVVATDTGSPYFTNWAPASAGVYTLIARATDNAGNRTDSVAVTISVSQNAPPVVNLLSPAAGATYTLGSGVVFFAEAKDANGTINNVRFLANGDLIGPVDTAAPFTAVWTPAVVGSYAVLAVGVDNDSNASTGASRTLNIVAPIGLAPTVVLTNPAAGATLTTASTISLAAAAADADGTVASVAFYDNGQLLATDTSAPFGVNWAPTAAGAHRLYAVATDSAGNVITSVPLDVSVAVASSSAPVVGLTDPGAQAVGVAVTLLATATDADGIVSSVQFFDDGLLIGSTGTVPYSLGWTPTRAGTHVLTALATDNSSNQVISGNVSVVVTAGAAPTVAITGPAAGAAVPVNGARLITATATPGTGTIASVRFFANGVLVGTDTAFPYEATWTPIALGTYSLVAIATDSVGKQASSEAIAVSVAANALPSVSITAPAAGTVGVGVSTAVAASASDVDGTIASVQFFANGVALGVPDTVAPFTATFSSLIGGVFNLSAVATDNLGATVTSAVVPITVTGGNAPLATITTPLTGAAVASGSSNTLSASATSVLAGSTIASVQFFANGVAVGTDSSFPYTAVWSPTAIGSYAITAIATDTAGNQGSSSSVNVSVAANAAPTVAISAPSAGAALPIGAAATISAAAADADGSVASVQFFIATNGGVAVALSTDTTAPFTATFTPATTATYILSAVATDNMGATTTSAGISVTTSIGLAPSVTITSPLAAIGIPVNATTSVTAQATAAAGTIASVQFFANGVSLGIDTSVPYAVAWVPAANGSYSLTAVATDTTGNATTSAAVVVSVAANVAPSVSISAPAGGAVVGVGVATTVSASAADGDGSIASVQFFVTKGSGAPVSLGTSTTAPFSVAWTPNLAGAYGLTALAMDNLGVTTTSAVVAVTVSGGNAPAVGITTPTAGATVAVNSARTISASATATGAGVTIASVQFFANGVLLGSDATFPYEAAWTPAATGTFLLTAIATDTAGNQATSVSVGVIVAPNLAPSVSVIAPASLGVGIATPLTAVATDSDGTVASVQFFVNGIVVGSPITAAPFTISFTSNVAGSMAITATATDNLGATATSAPVTISVSGGNAPTVNLTAPLSGSTLPVNVLQSLTATATATTGAMANVEFRVTTGGTSTSLGVDTTFPYSAPWTPTAVGAYVLTATATDTTGHQAVASSTVTVTATSNAGPSIAIASPANADNFTAGAPVVLFANASDANGSVTSVRFLVDGRVIGTALTIAPYSTTWTPIAAGTYLITAIAVDNDFNATTSATVAVTISPASGVLPTVSITSPLVGTRLTTRSTIPVIAGVSSLGVTQVQFFDNGVALGVPDTAAPFMINWSPTTAGVHRLVAVATAGTNIISSTPFDITVIAATSPNPPTVILDSPLPGTLLAIGTNPPASVALTASASDAIDGTITKVEFYVNGTLVGSDTEFPYSVTYTPPSLGLYSVYALATDDAGNVSTSAFSSFTTIAANAPTVAIAAPLTNVSIPVNTLQTISANVTPAAGFTITNVRFFAGSTLIGSDNSFPYSVNWTPSSTGPVVLTAVAIDNASVSGSSPGVNVTVAPGTPPTSVITSPANGTNLTVNIPTTLTASANATLPATVQSVDFRVNGVSVGIANAFPYSVVYTPTAIGIGFQIGVVVTDSQQNVFTTPALQNVTINVISAPGPTVAVSSPTAGTSVVIGTSTVVSANARAQAAGTTVGSVQFFANNVSIGTVTTAPYNISWFPTAGGAVALTARAIDSSGTATTSAGVNVSVTTPPALVAVTSPAAGASLPVNRPLTITGTATSTTGAVVSLEFLVNGVSVGLDNTFPFGVSWTPLTPGMFAITAKATDSFGTVTASSVASVNVVGGNVPIVAISTPPSGSTVTAGTPQTIVVNANTPNGTIERVELLADGVLLSADSSFPYNFAWTPGGLGVVELTAVAFDTQGNRSASAPVTITVVGISAGAPVTAIVSPVGGASLPVGVTTLISAVATDADGTIAQVEFLVNGASLGVDAVFPYNFTFTPKATGKYIITARATDNGGNIATSAPVSVAVSGGTAPSVAISSPNDGGILGVNIPQTITATAGSASGFITGVEFYLNGAPLAVDPTFPYAASWNPGAIGNYTLTARATDNLGNITDSAIVGVAVGASAAPSVSISNPVTGSSFTVGTPLTVAADAVDSDGSITQVRFFVNGVLLNGVDVISPYSTVWTANSVGIYTLTAEATDNNGNVSLSRPVTVTIGANAAPTVALTSPVTGSYSLGNLVLVSASANDSDGSIATVQFFANGLAIGTATAAPFSVSWRPSLAGSFNLTAQATDNVGNVAVTLPLAVTITSTAAPAVTIINPVVGMPYGVGNAIPFAATPSGGNGPIAQVQFFVNGASIGAADTVSPYSVTWTPNAPGTYQLLAIATDSAGLSSSTSATMNLLISGNNAPTVAITSPPSGTSVNGGATVILTAVAADADGTIASVRFSANGNGVGTATTIPFSTAWVPSAAGDYTVTAQATDNSGNVTNSTPITVSVVANRAPTVAVTAPSNGATLRVGSGVSLTATANDTDGTIASVQFFANGLAIGGADTTAPYASLWTPGAEGIYRITATALDNSGAATVSAQITVLTVIPGKNGSDITYSGNYQGAGESGRFAAINVRGTNATFIAFSNATPSRIYFFPGLAVDPAGGFAAFDTVGRSVISGNASDTGANGTMDAGRVTFIGAISFGTGSGIATGYYTGSITGRPDSTFAGIVNPDGGITVFVSDGTFRDAGASTVSANGSFTVTTLTGNRFVGRADPVTGFITGTLTGGPGGSFMAAISSGVSFSDGFLKNLSTRGQVGSGANILIAGFIVAGDIPKQVLIRAIGPSLTSFGVVGALADPQLQLFNGNSLIATNDNWGGASNINAAANAVGAFPLAPASLDAVIFAALPPGSYTAQVSGVGGGTGIALVELYDADTLQPFSAQKVTNVATRGIVSSGQNQLIAGFLVSGNTSKKVLIRAVGPTLGGAPFNVGGVLPDPLLRLVRSDSLVVRENDNWETGNDAALISEASAKVGAFPLTRNSKDAAILINLPPGSYSAQVTGSGTTTGVALVEVYEVP